MLFVPDTFLGMDWVVVGMQTRLLLLWYFDSGNTVDLLMMLISVDFFFFLVGGSAVFSLKCSLVLGGGVEG